MALSRYIGPLQSMRVCSIIVLSAYPKTPRPGILSLSKDGWRLRRALPFDKLRVLNWISG